MNMDGVITGETDNILGISVVNNGDVEHIIDVKKRRWKNRGP